ncbi:hypothetical protein [Bacillus mycoides]|nr:hypothetical protein [Bacillus mycoides]
MKTKRKFLMGVLWGSSLSIVLWMSLIGWIKILLTQFHYHKEWLKYFWNQ